MLVIKSIRKAVSHIVDSLFKFRHGSADAAARPMEYVTSGASGIMTAKGVKDCVVSYQCNDMVCFTVSVVGTTADVSNFICGNIPGLKKVTPYTTSISVGCKSFVHLFLPCYSKFGIYDKIIVVLRLIT